MNFRRFIVPFIVAALLLDSGAALALSLFPSGSKRVSLYSVSVNTQALSLASAFTRMLLVTQPLGGRLALAGGIPLSVLNTLPPPLVSPPIQTASLRQG